MRVLIACEFSGRVREAFAAKGHDAWSCDLLPTELPGNHIEGNVLEVLGGGWDLMIAHPPCTYLTNAGVYLLYDHVKNKNGKWACVHGVERWKEMRKAAEFFNVLKNVPIEKIAVENPIPHRHAKELIGGYTQLIQPWMFGEGETKATCLWLRNLSLLIPTNVVSEHISRVLCYSPGPNRWKERSRTFQGIADAMAAQWG